MLRPLVHRLELHRHHYAPRPGGLGNKQAMSVATSVAAEIYRPRRAHLLVSVDVVEARLTEGVGPWSRLAVGD